MLEIDFKNSDFIESEQKVKFTMYTITTSSYNVNDFMGFAYYESGVFKDFYLTIVLDNLPEGTGTMNDGEFGNLGAVLTLITPDRIDPFFDKEESLSLTTETFLPSDVPFYTY